MLQCKSDIQSAKKWNFSSLIFIKVCKIKRWATISSSSPVQSHIVTSVYLGRQSWFKFTLWSYACLRLCVCLLHLATRVAVSLFLSWKESCDEHKEWHRRQKGWNYNFDLKVEMHFKHNKQTTCKERLWSVKGKERERERVNGMEWNGKWIYFGDRIEESWSTSFQ
jgi:hypothetical protein